MYIDEYYFFVIIIIIMDWLNTLKLRMTLFSSSSIKKEYLLSINATCLLFKNKWYSIHNFDSSTSKKYIYIYKKYIAVLLHNENSYLWHIYTLKFILIYKVYITIKLSYLYDISWRILYSIKTNHKDTKEKCPIFFSQNYDQIKCKNFMVNIAETK